MRYENVGAPESSEDYLEAILVIRAERGFCRNADIGQQAERHQGSGGPVVPVARRGGRPRRAAHPRGAPPRRRHAREARVLQAAALRRRGGREDGIRGGVPPGALHLHRFFRETLFPSGADPGFPSVKGLASPNGRFHRLRQCGKFSETFPPARACGNDTSRLSTRDVRHS